MTDTLKVIPIKEIVKNPFQPRLNFNIEELEELAQSIKENGLIQPIIVRKSDIIGYELIAGERRLRASQMAGLENIPAVVKVMTSEDSMRQAIIENLQRQNLNPIEEAKAYQQLILQTKMTHEDIAKTMGKSRPYITNAIRLLQLPDSILLGLERGLISSGHARLLLALPEEEQLFWYHSIQKNSLSVRQLEKKLKPKSNKQKKSDIFSQEIEKKLSQQLGLPVHIKINKQGKGKVTISFETQDDFHRILDNLL